MDFKIAVLAGDGIGPEISVQGVDVMSAVCEKFGHKVSYEYAICGADAIDKVGDPFPEATYQVCKEADAVLFSAVGDPKFDNDPTAKVRPEQGLLAMRKKLGLFANIRPVQTFKCLIHKSPLRAEKSCFYSLSICPPLRHVLDSICFYLKQKVQCSHMHELKQKEIFMVFGTFYNRTDMAHFLMPITGRDPNFKSFVLENYLQIRNIKQFAQLYHCSERSFNRKFKSCFHDTPYNWILNQKTRHIKGQLANRNIPISEIARTFHFASPSHFTTYCKKRLGITPSEFREKIAK